ncbi:preprotein translocase subunit SecA [Coxiella endosymbiont of Amblyomma americanum]|uniref:preprotein translocase subunit SecA n=1 Tax=Coxiella endosymbiont of Amblyomma americanum TaxID=325775 RepID=UPI0005809513|nr:preprotein translocase subunit SecA [Coxiella endosymbiont of Amblyomma americanum]AJC50401.1 preprotein translocase subunit SecA [Coxiella endosymbiont of Amblyomma americanum]AUJ58744.1 preprotein translocase subunit SecA [Coxiella-like endosymbiont of Amblyomma americanum]
MLGNLIRKVIGTRNDRLLKSYFKTVVKINALESKMKILSNQTLSAKTSEFQERFQQGESLDILLPETFAVVREVSMRTLGLRHLDVQLIGGIALYNGKVAEMRTGEGKTLVATMPAYLNALTGKGVHIVTVNDYLAKRDMTWMKPIYEFLGLTVGINVPGMTLKNKQVAYLADVTYGTNNEFGFDYLRDNMVFDLNQRVQRSLHYAIIDEVDSILIDEARTPLIISGQSEESSDLYVKINKLIPLLTLQTTEKRRQEEILKEKGGDYIIDEKNRQVYLTEQGYQTIEDLLVKEGLIKCGASLYDVMNISLMYYVHAALRAHVLLRRDVHYVVKNNEVIIVDEHTGRLIPGRRWSDGLHQAVESKEGKPIQLENQTLAMITLQNYFRLYEKLSGMTGTADTEAFELQKIYGLEVIVVPTNKPMLRRDEPDQVYLTEKAKLQAIIKEVKKRYIKGQPLLIGTASITASEVLSQFLKKSAIKHEILNAKNHEREAKIIAEAGRPKAVTIATNMAGRGTDIVLGGNLESELAELDNPSELEIEKCKIEWKKRHDTVIVSGGLHVLGTERHESRRIDNQLRGRSGRQGDPGSSQFYLSMEDSLLRIFASDRVSTVMRRLGVKENDVIEHKWLSRAIEKAQQRVEAMNFDVRKQLLEFDDVANDQRKVVYQQRFELLKADNIANAIKSIREEVVHNIIDLFVPRDFKEEWNIHELEKRIKEDFGMVFPIDKWLKEDTFLYKETLCRRIIDRIEDVYKEKEKQIGLDIIRNIEKTVTLQLLDHHWKEHLAAMDHLRQGIHLRGYAQKNPTQEYKRESFVLFTQMLMRIKYDIVATLLKLEAVTEKQVFKNQRWLLSHQSYYTELRYKHPEKVVTLQNNTTVSAVVADKQVAKFSVMQSLTHPQPKIRRNRVCPCGSGQKYKYCHGKLN